MARTRHGQRAATDLAEQRRELPDAPGVYLFQDARRRACSTSARRSSIRKRVASHFSGRATAAAREAVALIDRRSTFLVTANEAEALLAEQSFIKRHRPRFNIRLRDDKSYPYIGVSLDEELPARLLHPRAAPRRAAPTSGPFSSAKRVRETLDLLGKLFQYRTCEGAGARPPLRQSPASTTTSSAARRPASATSTGRSTARNIDAIVDFLSGRYREIERDLEDEDGGGRRGAGVRAGGALPRPAERGPLADSSASGSPAARSAPPT